MKRLRTLAVLVATVSLIATGCGGKQSTSTQGECDGQIDGPVTIDMWFHGGHGVEREAILQLANEFNISQDKVKVNLKVPSGLEAYADTVKAAAAGDQLPGLLDFDGPYLPSYAWAGDVVPIDSCISQSLRADVLASLVEQGTYGGKLYGVGYYQGSYGLWADRTVLEANGIRIPEGPGDAWKADELTQILKKLQAAGFKHPLDVKENYGAGEWYTFGFSPFIQSGGADLIDRSDYQHATGTLNSQAAVKAMTILQSWFKDDLIDPNEDDAAFIKGRSPLSLVGGWEYPRYSKALGDKLIALAPPDFGGGAKSGNGSWQWGVTKNAADPDAAWAFVEFMLSPDHVMTFPDAAGQGPPTKSAVSKSKLYGPGGDLAIYSEMLANGITVTRPSTPAYPTITSEFARAVQQIIDGKDVKAALNAAAQAIDQDIADNDGYPAPKG
jgi:multiple sugar transport system substrate-binding protein